MSKKLNLPNTLSLIRVLLVPFFMASALYMKDIHLWGQIVPAFFFALASFTDFLDGNIARKYNLVTDFGKFIDPLADKFMVFGACVTILTVDVKIAPVFVWVAALVMLRELAITSLRLVVAGKSGVVIAASFFGKMKTVTQIAPNDEAKNFGMCYVFALGEGHFLIYDGLGDRGGDEDKIYASLRSSTPEGQKPIIDAWILTHPHFDHIAGVWKFALKYHDAVEVRNFVMNMLPPYRYPMQLWKEAAACHARWLPEIFNSFPEAKIQKAHTGQTFSVGDARVEVLYTQEEFSGFEAPMNDTSLVTRVFLGGKTLIFPADISGDAECRWIHDLYGSYLKSDFYQLAHHAWDTEVLHFYYDIDPTDMLWPLRARDWDRERMWTFPATQVYKAEYDAGSRRFHIARGEDIVIPLGE